MKANLVPSFLFAFLLISSTLLLSMAENSSPFVGRWTLTETYNESMEAVDLPQGNFPLLVRDADEDDSTLQLFLTIGNSMRTQVTLNDDEADDLKATTTGPTTGIQIGFMASTMMMPAEPLYKLENLLSELFPKMTWMGIDEETDRLVFSGEGKIVFDRDTKGK